MSNGSVEDAAPQRAVRSSSHGSHGEEWALVDAPVTQDESDAEVVDGDAEEKDREEQKRRESEQSGSKPMDSPASKPGSTEALPAGSNDDLSSHMSHPNWLTSADADDEPSEKVDEKVFEVSDKPQKCSNCSDSITGIRYKCLYCQPGVNLCSSCEERQVHNELHPLIKIRNQKQCPDDGDVAREKRAHHIQVIRPVGVTNGSTLEPGEVFWAGWALKRTGTTTLRSCRLAFSGGNNLSYSEHDKPALLPPLRAGAQTELMVELKAPNATGPHRGVFRLRGDKGELFGPALVVEVNVHSRPK